MIAIVVTGVEQMNADLADLPDDFPVEFVYGIIVAIIVLTSLIPLIVLWGSVRMLQLKSYTLAMAAAVLSLLTLHRLLHFESTIRRLGLDCVE